MKLGYIGLDQYGGTYHIEKHPRKELMEQIGINHVNKMYVDLKSGGSRHSGYVIGALWITVHEVHTWNRKGA